MIFLEEEKIARQMIQQIANKKPWVHGVIFHRAGDVLHIILFVRRKKKVNLAFVDHSGHGN